MNGGTPRELMPIAEQVLSWVARERSKNEVRTYIPEDDLRRIELCALATREAAMFFDLYGGRTPTGHLDHVGGDPHATSPDLQDERRPPGRLPAPKGCR